MSLNTDDLAYFNMRITRIENFIDNNTNARIARIEKYIDDLNDNITETIKDLERTMKPIIKRLGEMDNQVRQHEHYIKILKQRFEAARQIRQQLDAGLVENQHDQQTCDIL